MENKIMNFKNEMFNVDAKEEDGQVLFNAEKVAKNLGIGEMKNNKFYPKWTRINKYLNKDKNSKIKKGDYISKDDIKKLIQNSRCVVLLEFLKEIGIEQESVIVSKETETIAIIIEALKNIVDCKTQHYIDGYKIDLYIPSFKLAIECDEYNHSDRDQEYEAKREKYIKNKLNCKFIRYNPDEPNFNIGTVINQILLIVKRGVLNA